MAFWTSPNLESYLPEASKVFKNISHICVALTEVHSSLHFKGLEMDPTFPWNQPSPEEHGMTADPIPTKHMTKMLCWPSLGQLQPQVPRGLILDWDNNVSIASTC